jgi:serine/threonine protein kinase
MSILRTGSTVGNYKIVKLMGQNPLGESYLGALTGSKDSKRYTIKVINLEKVAEVGLDPSTVEQEARILTQVSNNPMCDRYITCYYDYFIHNIVDETVQRSIQYLVIVTDYIQGPTLQDLILNQIPKGSFDMPTLLKMMVEIAQSVDYIHTRGVAHQNIKPSNIIYDKENGRLRLIDFSMSCSQTINKRCKGKAGTVYYMPPELIESQVDPTQQDFAMRKAHDIWSMGVIFYQMANLGQDYMDFTGNDPSLIAKEIQISPVKTSRYPYIPINSVISTMLNKDYTARPSSGQVVILLRLARPLCIVNDQPYDREVAEALVQTLDMDVEPSIDDYTLCKKLTDHLNICKIKTEDYTKESLLELAKILGIKATEKTEGALLCDRIQKGLQSQQREYSSYVTAEILRSLEYLAFLRIRKNSKEGENLEVVYKKLEESYTTLYLEAKKLDLIDLKMLEVRRKDVTRKSLVYRQTSSIAYASVYATLANSIVQVILDNNADAEVGGIPLEDFQQRITQDA